MEKRQFERVYNHVENVRNRESLEMNEMDEFVMNKRIEKSKREFTSFEEKVNKLRLQLKLLGLDGKAELTVHRKGRIVDFEIRVENGGMWRVLWLAIGIAGFGVMSGCGVQKYNILELLLVDFEGWSEVEDQRRWEIWDYVMNMREWTAYALGRDWKYGERSVRNRSSIFG